MHIAIFTGFGKPKQGKEGYDMKYVCELCGYEYDESLGDPDSGITPGTLWINVPEDYVCPLCGAGKESFVGA